MYCQNCGEEVDSSVDVCPSCGTTHGSTSPTGIGGFDIEEYLTSRSVKIGIAAGVGAYALGWLLTVLWYISIDPQGPEGMNTTIAAGYFFYNGHLLGMTGGIGLESPLVLAFPLVACVVAGLVLRPLTTGQGRIRAVQGALAGYTILMVLGAASVLSRTVESGFDQTTALGPDPLLSGVFGFGYALLLIGYAAGAQNHAD